MPVIARRFTIMTLILVNFAIAFSALAMREERVAFRGISCVAENGQACLGRA